MGAGKRKERRERVVVKVILTFIILIVAVVVAIIASLDAHVIINIALMRCVLDRRMRVTALTCMILKTPNFKYFRIIYYSFLF